MDALSSGAPQLSPARHFEQLSDIRAEKRERLRGRNNVTSCRSPVRELDTGGIKSRLKEKRHEEFLRRRSVSPPPGAEAGRTPPEDGMRQRRPETDGTGRAANGHPSMVLTPNGSGADEAPGASRQVERVEMIRSSVVTFDSSGRSSAQDRSAEKAATIPDVRESNQQRAKGRPRKQRGQKVNIQTETIFQSPVRVEKEILENSSMRTEPGFVLVRESDLERLADYLEEALWREDSLKQKLAALQRSTSHLVNSSDAVWTTRFSEDLLRSKIRALEAQLHVCLQSFPPEGMEKLAVQMEEQRLVFEQEALEALQRATWEKAEALGRAETLQEAVEGEKAEARRWQSRYQDLKLNSGRVEQSHRFDLQQLEQQLRSQVELCRAREDELQDQVSSLRQDKRELQYDTCLLQEDNQTLREEIQQLRDGSGEGRDVLQQDFLLSERVQPRLSVRTDDRLEEQLRQSEEKLQLRQRECEELQTELDVMKQECYFSQVRLSQCRDELRKLSHRRRTRSRCCSWWSVCVLSFLLLAVAGVAMLCLWHPPFRDQAEDLYADVWTRIEGYLLDASSSRHSGCFRPI